MDEKAYKAIGSAGASNIVIGICAIIAGITAGILLIVNGAKLIKSKSRILL